MSNQIKIKRVINNNVVSAMEDNKEVIYMGSGIAYKKRNGDTFDRALVEKEFVLKDDEQKSKFTELINQISPEIITLSAKVVECIEKNSKIKMNSISFMALADHISFSLERMKKGKEISNKMLNEVKRYYPKEFDLGKKALEIIKKETGYSLNEDEAGFIAIHLINALGNEEDPKGLEKVKLIDKIISLIEDYFNIKFDTDSFYYERFITHLKFLASRLFDGVDTKSGDDFFYRVSKVQYPEIHKCVDIIAQYIEYNYHIHMASEEKGYLVIHITNLLKKANLQGG